MATFMATTASNGPRLKDPAAAKQVLDRFYWECDVEAVIREDPEDGQAHLYVYGYDWPAAWKMPGGVSRSDFQPDYDVDDGFEEFLKEIAPLLAEPLTIQAVGFEKCRFPLAACEWHILPGAADIEVAGFDHSFPERALGTPRVDGDLPKNA